LKGSEYEKAVDSAVGAKRRTAAAREFLDQALTFVRNLATFAAASPSTTQPDEAARNEEKFQ
jgi:hypothetical protein